MSESTLPQLSRRDALKAAAGLCGIALVAAGASTAQAAPAPTSAIKVLKGGRVKVALKKVPSLLSVGGVATIGSVRGVPVGVVRTGKKTYAAIDLRCTHQGVTVGETSTGWRCPAHGSTFTDTGQKVSGPAAGPLRPVRSRRKKNALFVG
jgi:thiosulfate dehydrogenase (quinone) large subunit